MFNQNELTARAKKMFPVIEKYLSSSLPQRAFCTQEGLAYSTFHFWLKKYRRRQHSQTTNSPHAKGFIPLHVQAPKNNVSHSLCTIEYPNGVIVRLSGKVEHELVTQLIQSTEM